MDEIDYSVFKNRSYILTRNEKVIDVGDAFLELTGYTKQDFLYKNISEVCKEQLRLTIDICDADISARDKEGFIFTKAFEAREIYMFIEEIKNINEKIYYFVEKPDSRLDCGKA
ncbi:MAG: resE5 [Clostridiaceae bacterium]|nr:resE5 [Clostridiaceae bacterium]